MDRINQMTKVHEELLEIFSRKNADYGDAFADYGPIGVLVRMGDKIRRAQSITKTGVTLVDDEKIRDTLMDLANYSCMAVMLLDEESFDMKSQLIKETQDQKQTEDLLNTPDY